MNCAKCQLIEMRVDKVKDGQIYYVCKNCGREEIVSIQELEEHSKEKLKKQEIKKQEDN